MFPGGGHDYTFHVTMNGETVKSYRGGIRPREGKFDDKFFGLYKSLLFDTYKLSPEDLRQWYSVEFPPSALTGRSQLTIECSLSGTVDDKNNFVIVFGDYTNGDNNLFEGPCIEKSNEDTSMIKIMPYTGDYRFEKITTLSSKKTESEYYNGLEWQNEGFIQLHGIQSGNYRIRVELIGKDGEQIIL